jgi:hypothetical protein
MRFGEGTAKNIILSLWDSRGGKGKTSLLRVVNSVWGHPQYLTSSKTDTLSSRYQVLGARRNLPFCMDELTTMNDHDLTNLLFDIVNGLEKRKSQSSGVDLADTGYWETITFLTSNRSVYELLKDKSAQTTAEKMRAIEIKCEFRNYAGTPTGEYISRCISLLEFNYGLAGRYFIQKCLNNPSVFEDVTKKVSVWDREVRLTAEERFWTIGLGLILEVGRLVVSLGLLNYDLDSLDEWVRKDLIPGLRYKVQDSIVTESFLLGEFLNERLDCLLVVKAGDKPKREDENVMFDNYVSRMPTKSLQVRLELDTRTMYIGVREFDTWCITRRLSIDTVLQGLVTDGIYDPIKGKSSYNLAKGVPILGNSRRLCYKFINAPDEFVEGWEE